MRPLLERLDRSELLVADGAMGTLLFARGIPVGTCPESVNLSNPEILEDIAAQYLQAGAEILQTNTFGGSPLKLSQYGLEGKTEEINRRAVAAVRKIAGDRAYVSASCGPSGKILAPYGDTKPEEVYQSFLRQMRVLVSEGVDLLCIETMTDLDEALLAVKAARNITAQIPIIATMTFDATPRGFFTIMGTSVEKAASELERAGADVIGSNCGNGIEIMVEVAREFQKQSAARLAIQSNAGLPEMVDGAIVYRETPEFMAAKAEQLISIGVSIIGGCCGTTPEHIAALRKMVDTRHPRKG